MKLFLTSTAAIMLCASTAFAGNLAPALSEPPVMRPVATETCEPYLVAGTNYFNFHAGCTPAGNEENDEPDQIEDIGQPHEECKYAGSEHGDGPGDYSKGY